jgi:protein phosphatase 1G
VLSRGGEAIEMSYDHKPESEPETLRIVKAGGKVTEDGRVNGGLNLSRAIGDHSYKQNSSLPPEEQMISPQPSIQHIEIELEKDEFIVLACDGVWNSMSSQEVVDFVAARISSTPSLSKICEEVELTICITWLYQMNIV